MYVRGTFSLSKTPKAIYIVLEKFRTQHRFDTGSLTCDNSVPEEGGHVTYLEIIDDDIQAGKMRSRVHSWKNTPHTNKGRIRRPGAYLSTRLAWDYGFLNLKYMDTPSFAWILSTSEIFVIYAHCIPIEKVEEAGSAL